MSVSTTNATKAIFTAGIITGLMDGAAAIIQFLLKGRTDPEIIFKYIASAVFGKEAYEGDTTMIIWGVLFHLVIAFIFAIIFFFLYPVFNKIFKRDIVIGLVYGVLVWAAMNLLVVPMSKLGWHKMDPKDAVIAALILMLCIGLPNALITGKYYRNTTK